MLLNVLKDGPYNLILRLLRKRRGLDDKCLRNLSSLLVWNLDHGTVGHCGVREKMGLEFGGCDLVA